ncbi:Cullin repeat-like-containing domain protein [Lipomyces tetrasporus]|uniref:Exocyst complex protein EXO70 n=1 Tax=Lipomyces tetrasporus TaxID=54092 RepID=A0AAD7QLR1_9ASCO|nr:Cullin repeat-like-containing domain protein [Lipomyces tetrasporus]KAJ8097636.1 Cullin repeat-like-containing domain protein [Lipomyces tetrasporus]
MSRPGMIRTATNSQLDGTSSITQSVTLESTAALELALQNAGLLAQQITGSLARLGSASTTIENAIKPISGSTQTYTNIAKNVEAAVSELEVLRLHQAVFEEEEPRIRRGNLEIVEYSLSISRLKAAIKSLEGSTLKSSQQVTLKMNQLINTAVSNVRDRYRKTLISVSPISEKEDTSEFVSEMPEDTVKALSIMVDFFMVTDMSAGVPIYADIRGKYIIHHLSVLSETATKTEIKRVNGFYRKGTSPFKLYMDNLLRAMVTEEKMIRAIFKAKADIQSALSATLKDLEKSFQATVQAINAVIRKNLITDCFYAYDVIEQIHVASGEILLATEIPVFNLESCSKDLRKTAQDSFYEILRHIEAIVSGLPALPVDFAVLDITKQVTAWVLRLADYDTTLASLLIPLGAPSAWSLKLSYHSTFSTATGTSTPKSSYMGSEILSLFISEIFDDLLVNIEAKARTQYKKVTRVGLQVIANLLYLERGLRSSQEVSAILTSGSGIDRLDKIRKRSLNMFLDGWKMCASYLMDVTIVRSSSTASGGKAIMSSKDREVIKEKFRNFNTTFDELVAKFKEYSFTDAELRAYLAKEVAFVSPLYQRFYEKHKAGEFSKHTEKYIKYNKSQLDQTLASLA